ncbi:MAG: hypothetical protein ABI675_08195 [Chitinophagaceae bacterium]
MKSSITATRHLSFLLLSLVLLTITPVKSWAQDEVFKNIEQRFEKFSGYSLQEKIYLHTDKNFYLAGEIIWFKIYYVDGVTHQALNLSKVAYVEIIDRNSKPVLQAKIALTEKGGSGSFYLPLTLKSDNYTLRAYTSWMRNSGPDYFFNKIVSIANTIKPAEGKILPDSVRVTADFFPEGGNMVQGVETKIAFHMADQYGKGVSAKGIITNDIGDTICHFSPSRFGIGNFTFKPLAGSSYKATVQLPDGRSFSSSLPVVYNNGYVMNVTDNKDGRIKVRVQARSKETGPRGENVFLLAHTRQKLKAVEYGFINYETDLVFYIDKSKLAEGISHFTLFNKDRQPVCERLVFTRPKNLITTTISTDKPVYEKREKVNLSIAGSENDKLTAEPDYSVSVYQVDSLQVPDEENIASYLWLSSDLHGQVESPGFYFSNEPNIDEAVDNLMLTHGWRRFRWENILGTGIVPATSRFMPEFKGHLISAKVTRIADGKVVRGIDCFLSFPSSPFGLSVAKTDSNGIVSFEVSGYYGPGEIIIQASHETTSSYRVDVLIPFAEDNPLQQIPFFSMTRKEEMDLTSRSIAMQAQNIYVADSLRRFYTPLMMDSFPFFGKPEFSYRLDDYKRFTTMEEVLREYVSSIDVALRNGKLYMSIFDDALKTVYSNEALVLIDGVPIMDYQKIFSYDPLKVKKLDIVPRRYVLGEIDYKGIASFETYQGKFDGFELTPGIISVDYDGLQLQREFYSPAYETSNEKEKRIPDYRSTLYWMPDSKGEQSSLQFYTSDLQGKFLVVLQGFNANGEPVSATGSFTVE